ncbi:MAG: HAD hydrolase-like protein [Chitinophagales bacterium]
MKQVKNILFDLDGTISDSRKGIFNGILYATEKLGITDFDQNELESFIGPPLPNSFEAKFNLDKQAAADAVDIFREYYADRGWSENEMYPSVKPTIEELNRRGYKLFVATSKPTVFAKQIIEFFGLKDFFEEVVGANLDNSRSEKSEIIQYIFDNHALKNEETLIVGDTKYDVLGAKHHKMFSVSVTYGFGLLSDIHSVEPDFVIDECDQLLNILIGDQTHPRPERFSKPFRSAESKPFRSEKKFKTIVFSHPEEVKEEANLINQLFDNGLDEMVIRKPTWTTTEIQTLLEQIKNQYHHQIYLCDQDELVLTNSIKGLHCSNAFYDSLTKMEQHQLHRTLKERGQHISISVHNPGEWVKRTGKFDQLYVCPIFESISKPGYKGTWDHQWLTNRLTNNTLEESIIALGGVSADNRDAIVEMGFDGAAVLGFIWQDTDKSVDQLKHLKNG